MAKIVTFFKVADRDKMQKGVPKDFLFALAVGEGRGGYRADYILFQRPTDDRLTAIGWTNDLYESWENSIKHALKPGGTVHYF